MGTLYCYTVLKMQMFSLCLKKDKVKKKKMDSWHLERHQQKYSQNLSDCVQIQCLTSVVPQCSTHILSLLPSSLPILSTGEALPKFALSLRFQTLPCSLTLNVWALHLIYWEDQSHTTSTPTFPSSNSCYVSPWSFILRKRRLFPSFVIF